ncbi:MAG: mannonate dehydratase [Verrucomicrobia bacterium]|nr:mannonate dehydratase [Verrucomicrobiota bacterium]
MKLGLGLYRHQLNAKHYQFALQCGCSHLVVHLVDYFRSSRANKSGDQPVGDDTGWGLAGDPGHLWSFDELAALKKEINAAGLQLEAIENFDPAHWHDVLLDGPKKPQQLENLKTLIRNVGRAGIPIFGYNFSIAGVAGRVKGGRNGRSMRPTDPQWHGLEHGLRTEQPARQPCPHHAGGVVAAARRFP